LGVSTEAEFSTTSFPADAENPYFKIPLYGGVPRSGGVVFVFLDYPHARVMTELRKKLGNDMEEIIKNKKIIKMCGKNIRTEKDGSLWGKHPGESNLLDKEELVHFSEFNSIAERWICSDDREFPSFFKASQNEIKQLPVIFENFSKEIFGEKHLKEYGSYLGCIMKLIDTNDEPHKGSLSLQVHSNKDMVSVPSKPEMWLSFSENTKAYVGWKNNMSDISVRNAIKEGNIFEMLNILKLKKREKVVVDGGIVHAIRYGSFLAEWSIAPSKKDVKKGCLKKATIALADNTDGKIPRAGKVNLELSIEILKNSYYGFSKLNIEDISPKDIGIFEDEKGNSIKRIFETKDVVVEEIIVKDSLEIRDIDFVSSFIVFSGNINFCYNNYKDNLDKGAEFVVPLYIKNICIINNSFEESKLYRWYRNWE